MYNTGAGSAASSSRTLMRKGVFRPVLVSAFSHSKNPVLTTTQRRFFRIAPENVGSFETVSLRALINGGFAGAFGCAHDGTKPH